MGIMRDAHYSMARKQSANKRPGLYALPGDKVKLLLAVHNCSIPELKARTGFTMKRIREVVETGIRDRNAARDWIQEITGTDPGENWSRYY